MGANSWGTAPAIGGALIYTRDDLFEMGLPTGFDVVNSPSDHAAPTLLSVHFMVSPEGTDWPEACAHTTGCAWERMGTHGNAWERMGTHGSAWEGMGTHGKAWERMGTH